MTAPNLKYCGKVRPGVKGPHVIAYKRALSRAGYMTWPTGSHYFTDNCGTNMQRAILAYKKDHKLDKVPVIGSTMHERLERTHSKHHPKQWAFDSYSISLMDAYWKVLHESPETKIRKAILDAARFWHLNRGSISYAQERPFWLTKPPNVPSRMDCSEYVTLCYFAGGAVDPNRRGYDGQGYTGTLFPHGRRCTYAELKPGDLVFYGFTTRPSPAFSYGDPTHVAVFAGHNVDTVYSMGSSVGPSYYSVFYRPVNRYVTFDVTP